MTDLELAVKTLQAKNIRYQRLWQYYDGRQPLIYSTERLRDVFKNLNVRFVNNVCAVIVNSLMDKLVLKRFLVLGQEAATQRLNDLWWATEMKLDDDEAHLALCVTGESYIIVQAGLEGVEAFYNDPRLCHIFYQPGNPRQARVAAKWWREADEFVRLTLYYPDRLEYYRAKSKSGRVDEPTAFQPLGEASEHDYGAIPVFHLRSSRRGPGGELTDGLLTLQDAINKLLADMMVAAEFGAFKQRWIISNTETSGKLKNAPNEIWDIPGGDGYGQATSVGEFAETELGNFMQQIEKLVTAAAVTTRTPKHYLLEKAGSNPSGEALMAMEAPLNAKAARYIERLSVGWGKVAEFMLRLDGVKVERRLIQPIFSDPRTLQPMTQAQARQTNVNAGLPLATVLRREGWSEEDLVQMETDKRKEQAAQQESLAQALLEQQRQFDQEQGEGEGENA